MNTSTKSLQHVNVPFLRKMLKLKVKKFNCGLIPLVLIHLEAERTTDKLVRAFFSSPVRTADQM